MKTKLKSLLFILLILSSLLLITSCGGDGETGEEPHQHSFDTSWEVVNHATADSDGLKTNTCKECNEKVEAVIPKHEHTFSAKWKISTPAKYGQDGVLSNECDTCKFTFTRALPYCETHTFSKDWTIVKQPTSENEKGKETNICDTCGATIIRSVSYIERVEIGTPPSRTKYWTNAYFNTSGLILKVSYRDGTFANITSGWQLITESALKVGDTVASVKYKDFTVEIPITVTSAVYSSVSDSLNRQNGTELFIGGICLGGGTSSDNSKYFIIKDNSTSACILLKGTDYEYKPGDRVEFFATLSADSYGKHLVFSQENENAADTVISSGGVLLPLSQTKSVTSALAADEILSAGIDRCGVATFEDKFYIVKSGDNYIVHFNDLATDASGARLPSGKTVRLSAENITEKVGNLPEAQLTSYPGVLVSGSASASYIETDATGYYLQILSADWLAIDPYTSGEEYVRELAYAFYYQLPYVDYDQYNSRRNMNVAPEDATSQQRVYLDCSSYVNTIYYNAFGENIMPYTISQRSASTANFMDYARSNPTAVDVLGYWESRDYDNQEDREALLSELLKNLKVGDVIVYRKGNIETLEETAGHALIYVGGGKILHCQNTESYTHNGRNPNASYDTVSTNSIAFESTYNLFENPYATRYLFNYVNFTILRPMNRELTPTEQSIARMTIPSLSIEKSVDKNMFAAVFGNDLITYTITLKNNGSKDLSAIELLEYVPIGTEFVSASEGISHNGGNISWSGTVKAKSTVTLSFTVRVTTDALGAVIESASGTVNGLKLNKITNTVSAISKEKLDSLSAKGDILAGENTEFSDPILMINAIYRELLGKDLLDYESISAALSDIINVENRNVNPDSVIADMVIANLSGGYLIRGNNALRNERIRAIRIEYLTAGDVIIAEHSTDKDGTVKRQVAYVYLGENEFLEVNSTDGVATITVIEEPDPIMIQNILTSLYSYEKYAVIRPSLANSAE